MTAATPTAMFKKDAGLAPVCALRSSARNQMAYGIEHMLAYDNARLEDVSAYKTGAWLAHTPCNVKGLKGCLWPDRAMLELLSGSGK